MLQKTSTKIIVLETTRGSFETGFEVSIQISDRGKAPHQTIYGKLPAEPNIPKLHKTWRSVYLDDYFRIILPNAQIKNVASSEERRNAGDALIAAMQNWLQQDSVKELEYALRDEIERDESAQLILKTQDDILQRLPWHRWSLFRRYDKLAMALHMPYPSGEGKPLCWPVRILVILGNSDTQSGEIQANESQAQETRDQAQGTKDIDVQKDRQLIESLPRTEVQVLTQPSRQQFSDALRDRQGWDVVFFAGHSESQETSKKAGRPDGVLYINEQDALSLTELSQALKTSVERGLQLLILNSCDGLGIAHSISEVRIPYQVVMREPVPDKVAHAFLRYFLDSFSHGEPLHRSLRIARDRLDEGLKNEFPSASWLPVVCQNPSTQPLWWPSLLKAPAKVKWGLVGVVGLAAIAGLSWGKINKMMVPPADFSYLEISGGSEVLVTLPAPTVEENRSLEYKEAGTQAYANGDFQAALAGFNQALAIAPNSPETLIYRNNTLNQLENAETVSIGVPLPMTADLNASLELMRGIAQVQNEINQAGGIQGKRLQILLADDGDDPDTADSIARAFGQNPDVVAVIGSNTSDLSLETLEEYAEGKIPVISAVSTSTALSRASEFFFRTVPSDAAAAQVLAQHGFEQWESRRAVLFYNEQSKYSQSLRQAFTDSFEALGGAVVSEFDFRKTSFNAQRSLELAKREGADVIVLLPSHVVLDKAIQVLSVNDTELPVLAGDDVYSSNTLTVGGKNALGAVVSVPWHPDNSPDPDFPDRALALWKANVSWRTALAYDTLLAIAKAMETEPTRAGIHRALSDPQFQIQGASGIVAFDSGGDRTAPTQLVEVVRDEQTRKIKFSPIRNAIQNEKLQND